MILFHIISGAVGFYLLYLTYTMRESAEGIWLNRIEEMWMQIDDRRLNIANTTRELFGRIADKVTRLLDFIFGTKVISFRAIGVSGCFSFASMLFTLAILIEALCYLFYRYGQGKFANVVQQLPILVVFGIFLIFVGIIFLTFSILSMVLRSSFWIFLSLFPTFLWLLLVLRLVLLHVQASNQLGMTWSLAIGFASDILLLMLIRQSLRWISERATLFRMLSAIFLQLGIISLIFIVPLYILLGMRVAASNSPTAVSLLTIWMFNIPTTLASLAFTFSLAVVLLHRLLWPFLSQWSYVLTRADVLKKRAVIRVIAWIMITFAVGVRSGFWWEFVQKVLK
jgi:hypothetical protein